MQETEFEINRNAAKDYFTARWVLLCVGVFGLLALPFAPICFVALLGTITGARGPSIFVPFFLL